ncbi:MAG TPA: FMN-binding negative transcriptional regulator [Chitinophagaceae bacterium]|jgi:transcriptional regulator
MYNYPHYKEHDRKKLVAFMQENPFVIMIGNDASGRLEASHIPVLVDDTGDEIVLTGHIARKSDHHLAFVENENVLVIFNGPHAYISGSWYTGNPSQASTWNYIAIHARGAIRFLDEHALIDILKRLSLHFENGNTSSSTIYDNLPAEYLGKLVKAIVAFEIRVTALDNVFKLSQNRDEMSYDSIIAHLKNAGGDAGRIGLMMEERRSQVFEP